MGCQFCMLSPNAAVLVQTLSKILPFGKSVRGGSPPAVGHKGVLCRMRADCLEWVHADMHWRKVAP